MTDPGYIESADSYQDKVAQQLHFKRLFFRIMPYWPWVLFILAFSIGCGYLYLRYATPVYEAQARVIVNDDAQEKSTNLLEAFKIDARNISNETEREMEVLSSKDLLRQLVVELHLYTQYSQKGFVKTGEFDKMIPAVISLDNPDSVHQTFNGEVDVVDNNHVSYLGQVYLSDTPQSSPMGIVRWHINHEANTQTTEKTYLTLQPVSEAVKSVKKKLTVEPISKQSSILEVTYQDQLPNRGVEILNHLFVLYGKTTVDYKLRISENTLRFLDERLKIVSDELGGVEKNLENFKSSQGITDLGTEGSLFLDQLKQTDSKISELDVQLEVIREIENYVTRRNRSNAKVPATLGITDPVLTELLNQLYKSEFELEKLRKSTGPKNPQIAVLEDEIAKLKPSITSSLNNLKLSMIASRNKLKADNESLSASLSKIPRKERQLIDISRQQGVKNTIYTFLLQKREEAAINAKSIVPNYRLIEHPESVGIVYPISNRIYVLALIIGLLLSSLIIYVREFTNSRILFRSQIEGRVAAPIVGEVIFQPEDNQSPMVVGPGKRTLIAEQFRELRTNLSYITANIPDPCKVLLVTSSIPSEGKSFVAINTAVSLCLTGSKVVLLEFDLRKPKISNVLGVSRDPGLSTYLIGKASADEIIKPYQDVEGFHIISSGAIPPNPAESMMI